jgi:hypothetical protein
MTARYLRVRLFVDLHALSLCIWITSVLRSKEAVTILARPFSVWMVANQIAARRCPARVNLYSPVGVHLCPQPTAVLAPLLALRASFADSACGRANAIQFECG